MPTLTQWPDHFLTECEGYVWKQEAGVSVPDHFPLYSSVLNLGRVFPSLQSEICDTVLNLFGMVYSGKDVQKLSSNGLT